MSDITNSTNKRKGDNTKRLENDYLDALRVSGVELPDAREYKFNPTMSWRADFAYTKYKILVEIEGGIWVRGRHVRGEGYSKDCMKYNDASLHGWVLLRFTNMHFPITQKSGVKRCDDKYCDYAVKTTRYAIEMQKRNME